MKNTLFKRTLSGAVLVLVVVGMTLAWYDPALAGSPAAAGWPFYLLWTAVGILTLWEYGRLVVKNAAVLGGKIGRGMWLLLGGLYVAQAFVLIQMLDPMVVVTLMTVVWLSDTGAYLVGSAVGRHPMAPKVSPKKTWEGFAGGLLFAVGGALVWYALYWGGEFEANGGVRLWGAEAYDGHAVGALKWAGFGLVVALAAAAGDLIESKFKRIVGVKDSGSFIPGHGGLLDRFDALLLAVPAAVGYVAATGLLLG